MPTYWGVTAPGVQKPGGPKWFAVHVSNLAIAAKKLTSQFTAFQTQTGTVAPTLKKMSSSFAAFAPAAGTLAAAGKKMAANFVATQQQQGSIAASQKLMAANLVAQQTFAGTMAAAMKPMNSNFVATMGEAGTMASSMKQLQALVNGAEAPNATIASSFHQLSADLHGSEIPSGTITIVLDNMSAILAGQHIQSGNVAAVLKQIAAALSSQQTQSGTIAALLKKAASAIAATQVSAIAFDAAGAGNQGTGATLSEAHVGTAGACGLAFIEATPGTLTPTSVTWGGTAMTQITGMANNNATLGILWWYKLIGIAGGSQSVVVNWSSGTAVSRISSASYKNVTTVTNTNKFFGSSTAPSSGAVTNTSPHWLVFGIGTTASGMTLASGATQRFLGNTSADSLIIADSTVSTTCVGTIGSASPWSVGIITLS